MQSLITLKNEGFIGTDNNDKEETEDMNVVNSGEKNKKLTMDELTANVFLFFAAGENIFNINRWKLFYFLIQKIIFLLCRF
jgi:hypothetical protein